MPECLREKPVAGGFYRNGANFDGLDRICKECMNLRFREPTSGPGPLKRALRDERRRSNVSDGFEGGIVPSLVYVFKQLGKL